MNKTLLMRMMELLRELDMHQVYGAIEPRSLASSCFTIQLRRLPKCHCAQCHAIPAPYIPISTCFYELPNASSAIDIIFSKISRIEAAILHLQALGPCTREPGTENGESSRSDEELP